MRQTQLLLTLAVIALANHSRGALQFTNVSSGVAATLTSAAYDGTQNFISAGNGSAIQRWSVTGARLQPANATVNGSISALSAAYGKGQFIVGGGSAAIFKSLNGLSWSATNAAFPNTASVQGLGFNSADGRFVAASSTVQATWTSDLKTWFAASLPSASFLESYRGATSFGANGFAICGIRNVIRVSTDGGATLVTASGHAFNGSAADLLGIASDGVANLVAVGATGAIFYSTDSGTTWLSATSPAPGVNLNAVAYNGTEFIAVGDGGVIIASAKGSSWSLQTAGLPAGFKNNLLGLGLATGGQLGGVGLLVGGNGTAVLVGTAPPPPINPISTNNCSYLPLNNALSVSVTNSTYYTVDWFDTNGTVVAKSSLTYIPTDQIPGTYTYFAQARDQRTGFVSATKTPVTLTLLPRPTALVSGNATICNGGSTLLEAALTGTGPWQVTWSDGFVQTTNASPALHLVTPTNPNPNAPTNASFVVTDLADANGCSSFPSNLTGNATVTINPRPAAVASGNATICNGSSTVVQAALTGIAPWVVTWSDGFRQTNGASPATHTVSPGDPAANAATNVTYTVTSLTDANCTANAGDLTGSAKVTINPRPAAVVSGNTTICNGSSTVVQAALIGTAPWVVTWSDGFRQTNGASPATHTVSPADPFTNAGTNVTYTVTSLTDANCTANAGDLTGSAKVTINPRPAAVVSGNTTICNGSSTVVQAALIGTAPWVVTWSDGFRQTNGASPATHTVSPADPFTNAGTNLTYTVTSLTDANCTANAGDLTGSATVTINPRPAAAVSGNAAICNGSSTVVQAALTGIAPWVVTWSDGFRQTNGASPAAHTVSPGDPFTNAGTNVTYTVTSLTDANCTANTGDLTGSATVAINPRPAAVVSGNATICNGSSAVVQAALTGIAPWVVTWSDGFRQTNGASPAAHTVSPGDPFTNAGTNVTYTVTSLTDANCTANAGDLTGSATVTVNPRPAPPSNPVNQIGCAGLTNLPLSVTVPPGTTVDWYSSSTGGSPLTSNSMTYSPTNKLAGTYNFYAEARNLSTQCLSTNRTLVSLTLESCVDELAISRVSTNVLVEWFGNFQLQSAIGLTNTPPSGWWRSVSNGLGGITNYWLVPATGSQQFFRLHGPTQ